LFGYLLEQETCHGAHKSGRVPGKHVPVWSADWNAHLGSFGWKKTVKEVFALSSDA